MHGKGRWVSRAMLTSTPGNPTVQKEFNSWDTKIAVLGKTVDIATIVIVTVQGYEHTDAFMQYSAQKAVGVL